MATTSGLTHRSNEEHARGRHRPNKKINHQVNYKNAKFRPVLLVRQLEKCCDNFSCLDCRKAKIKAMKLKQVKAITISPLHSKQTGSETLRWPPLANWNSNSEPSDHLYRNHSCHFLFTGRTVIMNGRKEFSPEHMDGPVIEKTFDRFQDKDGNIYAFISGESTSASELEELNYCGTASDNNLPIEPPKKRLRTVLKEEREVRAKLAEEKDKLLEEKDKLAEVLKDKRKLEICHVFNWTTPEIKENEDHTWS